MVQISKIVAVGSINQVIVLQRQKIPLSGDGGKLSCTKLSVW